MTGINSHADRRGALLQLTGITGAMALSLYSQRAWAARAPDSPLPLPKSPMRLHRKLTRQLRGGEQLTVSRAWEIRFAPTGRGITVSGVQIEAVVETPAMLKQLATIEENRSTKGMWPILLSPSGEIIAAGNPLQEEDVTRAVKKAENLIAARDESAADNAHHIQYLLNIQNAGASLFDKLPPDLFFPKQNQRRIARPIALPEGAMGQFTVSFEAETDQTGGWLKHATRTIETRIADNVRIASEHWMMEQI